MKIGILYIGIGRYSCFWPGFYKSCQRNLVSEAEKHYYVFTDRDAEILPADNVEVYHQDDMGWPLNSLFRFKMFNRIKESLKENDYLFFFNANAEVVVPVSANDFLPVDEDYSALCMSQAPDHLGHETRPSSVCCVMPGETDYYFSGALNGGKCKSYLELIEACEQLADTDFANGIMPVWHDESVINRFLVGKSVKRMSRVMGKPANWRAPRNAKIILRRKEDVLGRGWLRNFKGREHTNTWLRKLLRKLGIIH